MEKNRLNLDSIATLVFCCDLKAYNVAPLTLEEWYEIEKIMKLHGLKGPASLLNLSVDEMIEILNISDFVAYKMKQRIKTLHVFLGLLNDLESKGVRLITKYDECYPSIILKSMKKRAPIYFYVSGKIESFNEGISICGLNEIKKKDSVYTKRIVDKIIVENKYYISHDSKGADHTAFIYALHHKCKIMMFVCDNMIQKVNEYQRYIKNGQLVIISAVDPICHFNVTHAIDRNSYVCGLSKYQIIISSKINNGATWFTALQNMHHHWVEPLVLDNHYMGNQRLLEMQATPLYVKDVLSDMSFEMIFQNNQKHKELDEVNIDQMSIFEFIGENDESEL